MRRFNPQNSHRRSLVLFGLIGAMVLGLAACYPGGPEEIGDLGMILTFSSPSTDYSNLMTYAMEDTVIVLDTGSSSDPLDQQFNSTIIETLHANMAARGFTREMDPATNKPDVWLAVGAVKSEVWFYWYDWGYWGGYPGWGGYYPPYVGTGSFEQGSVLWQMLDLRDITDPTDPDAEPTAMWLGGINGALRSSTSANHDVIEAGINQAFEQSPYISAASKQRGQEVN